MTFYRSLIALSFLFLFSCQSDDEDTFQNQNIVLEKSIAQYLIHISAVCQGCFTLTWNKLRGPRGSPHESHQSVQISFCGRIPYNGYRKFIGPSNETMAACPSGEDRMTEVNSRERIQSFIKDNIKDDELKHESTVTREMEPKLKYFMVDRYLVKVISSKSIANFISFVNSFWDVEIYAEFDYLNIGYTEAFVTGTLQEDADQADKMVVA